MSSSSNSNSCSLKIDDRWVEEICKTFSGELVLDIDVFEYPCVFRVPKYLSETKPHAYAPQEIGLGPFHHHKLDLYTMQMKKLAAVVEFLRTRNLDRKFQTAVNSLMPLEVHIRASYHDLLDIDPQPLSCIITIDAVYLLIFLQKCSPENSGGEDDDGDDTIEKLAGDILMLENQIPAIFLIEALKNLNIYSEERTLQQSLIEDIFHFCRRVSPLELKTSSKQHITAAVWKKQGHLLSMMYHSILINAAFEESPESSSRREPEIKEESSESKKEPDMIKLIIHPGPRTDRKSSIGKPATAPAAAAPLSQLESAVTLFDAIWGNILGLFKSVDPDYEANRGVEEIRVPCVSQLKINAGITIAALHGREGIKGIKFDERGKKLYLPVITLNSYSEVILRNLRAYEAARYRSGQMGEYVDLMCGIVDTAKDVDILRRGNIIKGGLETKEIVAIFSGMRKSAVDKEKKTTTNIGEAIERVNKAYGESRKVRVWRFIWKVMAKLRILMIFLVVLGIVFSVLLSGFCQIRDCRKL